MSATTRLPEADPLYARPAPERPFYATGMLLDAGDFRDEQTYHRGRLAQAVGFLTGGGTLAGLAVAHTPEGEGTAEEVRVAPGLAVDRLGRLVEVPRPACLRLGRWWESTFAIDDGDTLLRAAYEDPGRFVSPRAAAEAGTAERPAIPERAVVADVFLRFVACERGLTPSFAAGPFDALDAVSTSRLRDAYELLLVPRDGLDDDFDGLPPAGEDLSAIEDPDARRSALQDAVLAAWPEGGSAGLADALAPLPEHPRGIDPTAQLLARALIPVGTDDPPERDGAGVMIDNWPRRFVPSNRLLQRWLGI
jgi:hypothetical protein